jgi:hypothetical protein
MSDLKKLSDAIASLRIRPGDGAHIRLTPSEARALGIPQNAGATETLLAFGGEYLDKTARLSPDEKAALAGHEVAEFRAAHDPAWITEAERVSGLSLDDFASAYGAKTASELAVHASIHNRTMMNR